MAEKAPSAPEAERIWATSSSANRTTPPPPLRGRGALAPPSPCTLNLLCHGFNVPGLLRNHGDNLLKVRLAATRRTRELPLLMRPLRGIPMRKQLIAACCAASMVLTGCATTYTVTPVPTATQVVRYDRGAPTATSQGEYGAVMVTPQGVNQAGRLVFSVVAYNDSDKPSNFGTENLSLTVGGLPTRIYTHAELEREAKNAATTALVLTALAGAASAYAANQNAYSTGHGRIVTPYGVSTYSYSQYNPTAAAVGTAAATATTAVTMANIQNSLDETLARLGGTILQTTTVDPGSSFGGLAVSQRLKMKGPQIETELVVNYNGETHRFRFTVAKAS